MTRSIALTLVLISVATIVGAGEQVDYVSQVKPILKARCYSCHGALKRESDLRLDTGPLIHAGGEGGPVIDVEDVDASSLLRRVVTSDESVRMPPEGEPLTKAQVDTIRLWIKQGASSPEDEQPEEDPRDHWAFQIPRSPPLPVVKDPAWAGNPIDSFIASEHEKRGLAPLPAAKRHILLRRIYLDLVGLPPTSDQLNRFLQDNSAQAFESVVDELLESKHYGERWGRHWMDVWRYSDWYGRRQVNDVRNSYPHIWRWRDWIVNSLNEDKGYDQMVREMLAADELYPEDDTRIAALGFIVRNWFSLNYDTWKQDLVEHTGKAFLGLRLNCAHCHDHKYDPISQVEYFKFRAFFEPLEFRHDRVPGGPALTKYIRYKPGSGGSLRPITAGLPRVYDHYHGAKTYMYRLGDTRDRFDRPPVEPGAPAVLGGADLRIEPVALPPLAWNPGLKPFVQRDEVASHEKTAATATEALAKARADAAQIAQKLASAEQQLIAAKANVQSETVTERSPDDVTAYWQLKKKQKAATLAVAASEAAVLAAQAKIKSVQARYAAERARFEEPSDTAAALANQAALAERNARLAASRAKLAKAEQSLAEMQNADKRYEKKIAQAKQNVSASKKVVADLEKQTGNAGDQYTSLGPQYPKTSTGRRRALATWIASNENPLTARVAVNHIWMRHFGRPLVESVFDFGRGSKPPTHPELLDWLACELMENGWSMKHIHRLIVTSNTYRVSSRPGGGDHPNFAIDKDNKYWWKFDRRRLEAEIIRDSLLHVSGQLDTTLGGRDLDPKQQARTRRRSIYYTTYPEAGGMMQFMTLFDAPDPCGCYRRSQSVVPQQALAMSNSELALDQGKKLAQVLTASVAKADSDGSNDEFVVAAFEQILSRPPTSLEIEACNEFLVAQQTLLKSQKVKEADMRARQSLVRVLLNHNEFVTVH